MSAKWVCIISYATKFNILSHSEMEALCVLDTITANKTVQIQAADERRSKIHGCCVVQLGPEKLLLNSKSFRKTLNYYQNHLLFQTQFWLLFFPKYWRIPMPHTFCNRNSWGILQKLVQNSETGIPNTMFQLFWY